MRLWRGEWLKEDDGAWNFHADPTDFGFGAMIRDDETYESLLNVVRMRYVVGQGTPVVLSYQFPAWILGPLGRRSLPISVTTTTDIPVMLSVREWFTELVLVVTIGAESVARFHFNRRDNFVIGRKRFVVDGSQDQYARDEYQSKCTDIPDVRLSSRMLVFVEFHFVIYFVVFVQFLNIYESFLFQGSWLVEG